MFVRVQFPESLLQQPWGEGTLIVEARMQVSEDIVCNHQLQHAQTVQGCWVLQIQKVLAEHCCHAEVTSDLMNLSENDGEE